MKITLIICALLCSLNSFASASDDLPRFFEVVKGQIYRGAQPTDKGIQMLNQIGITTVLDLRNEDANQIAAEGELVKSLRMKFISIPLDGFLAPKDKDMNDIQDILKDQSLWPIFVHCQHGQDRTGLTIGLYRVFAQGVPAKFAEREMKVFGFHEILLGLNYYFEIKTWNH